MITLSLDGGTRKEHNLAYDAFHFAIKYLMPRKKNLSVDITITDIPDDADAYHCCVEKGEHEIEIQSGLIEEDFVSAIFHEMVHVMQYANYELEVYGEGHGYWQGQTIKGLTYETSPWEIEAYHIEQILLKCFNAQREKNS